MMDEDDLQGNSCTASAKPPPLIATRTLPRIIEHGTDKKHRSSCNLPECARCAFEKTAADKLAVSFPILPADWEEHFPTLETSKQVLARSCWLAAAKTGKIWGLGCVVCAASGFQTIFGKFLWQGSEDRIHFGKLGKHHDSADHRRAAACYLGLGPETTLPSPPTEEFRIALQQLFKGSVIEQGKHAALRWCLHEALMDMHRGFVRGATTMSLCRDERQRVLLLRYVSVDKNLNISRGVLGAKKESAVGADGIVSSTHEIFQRFCTRRHEPPRHGDSSHRSNPGTASGTPGLDKDLLVHLRNTIEVVTVDAASDETLAVDIGRGRRASANDVFNTPLTPNVKFIARDKAHALRRQGFKQRTS
jgi:hypothetical protein